MVGRSFCGDDFKLEAEVSYGQGKMDPHADSVWILGWRGDIEHRLGGMPVSGFVGYTGARYDQGDDSHVLYEHPIGFGVRLYFGQESLEAKDRDGRRETCRVTWSGTGKSPAHSSRSMSSLRRTL